MLDAGRARTTGGIVGFVASDLLYSLPQNVHIAVGEPAKSSGRRVVSGFFPAVASSIRRIDGCLGSFIDFPKRTNRYDNSIVILTADHGDSLGEGRPLGPRVLHRARSDAHPADRPRATRLRERMPVDLSALTFSSDIVPSCTRCSATNQYRIAGRTCGVRHRPTTARGAVVDEFLLASSYGAVCRARRNGTRMAVVDAVDGSDSVRSISPVMASDSAAGHRNPIERESRAHSPTPGCARARESLPSEVMTAVTHARRTLLLVFLLAVYLAPTVRSMAGDFFRRDAFDPFLPTVRALEQRIAEGRFADALPLAIELDRAYPRQAPIALCWRGSTMA